MLKRPDEMNKLIHGIVIIFVFLILFSDIFHAQQCTALGLIYPQNIDTSTIQPEERRFNNTNITNQEINITNLTIFYEPIIRINITNYSDNNLICNNVSHQNNNINASCINKIPRTINITVIGICNFEQPLTVINTTLIANITNFTLTNNLSNNITNNFTISNTTTRTNITFNDTGSMTINLSITFNNTDFIIQNSSTASCIKTLSTTTQTLNFSLRNLTPYIPSSGSWGEYMNIQPTIDYITNTYHRSLIANSVYENGAFSYNVPNLNTNISLRHNSLLSVRTYDNTWIRINNTEILSNTGQSKYLYLINKTNSTQFCFNQLFSIGSGSTTTNCVNIFNDFSNITVDDTNRAYVDGEELHILKQGNGPSIEWPHILINKDYAPYIKCAAVHSGTNYQNKQLRFVYPNGTTIHLGTISQTNWLLDVDLAYNLSSNEYVLYIINSSGITINQTNIPNFKFNYNQYINNISQNGFFLQVDSTFNEPLIRGLCINMKANKSEIGNGVIQDTNYIYQLAQNTTFIQNISYNHNISFSLTQNTIQPTILNRILFQNISNYLNLPFNVLFNSSTNINPSRSYFENNKLYEYINTTHLRIYDFSGQKISINNNSINASCKISLLSNFNLSSKNTFLKCYNRSIVDLSNTLQNRQYFIDFRSISNNLLNFWLFNRTEASSVAINQFCRANILYSNQLINPEIILVIDSRFNDSIYLYPTNINYETIIPNNTAFFFYDKELNSWFYSTPAVCGASSIAITAYALSVQPQCGEVTQEMINLFSMISFIINNINVNCNIGTSSVQCSFNDNTGLVENFRIRVYDIAFNQNKLLCTAFGTTSASCTSANSSILVDVAFLYKGQYYHIKQFKSYKQPTSFLEPRLLFIFMIGLIFLIFGAFAFSSQALVAIIFLLGLISVFSIFTLDFGLIVIISVVAIILFILMNRKSI